MLSAPQGAQGQRKKSIRTQARHASLKLQASSAMKQTQLKGKIKT